MRDFYSILGVKRDAGADEIKAAWRRQAKSAHPDQNPEDPLAHSRFAEIGHAYDILKDPAKRRRYDQQKVKGDGLDRDNTIMKQREAAQAAAERAKQAKANAERVMAELAQAEAEKAKADAVAAQAAQNARTAQAAAQASRAAQSAAQAAAQSAAQSAAQATAQAAAQAENAKTNKASQETGQAGNGAAGASSDKPESPEDMVSRIFGEGPEAAAAADTLRREREAADAAAANGTGRTQASILSPIELFSSLVRRFRGPPAPVPEKAPDVFAEAIVAIDDLLGQKSVPITLNDGREVRVPLKGVTDGHVVRLREQGLRLPGMNRGDVAVTVRVARSERFIVDGFDLHTVLPITLENAVLGCDITIEGPDGNVPLSVPAWSNSDQVIRIEGLGLPNGEAGRGALVIELRVMLWEKPDEKVTDLMRLMREGLYI